MKLAKVEHDRCNEWAATTYVWVNDSMTEGILSDLVKLAKESYLAAEEAFKNDPKAPPAPNWSNKYAAWPDKTVSEAETLFQEREKARKAWEAKRDAARKPFGKHLIAVSGGTVQGFYDVTLPICVEVSWGHRHGTTIEYGDTNPQSNDLNAVQEWD